MKLSNYILIIIGLFIGILIRFQFSGYDNLTSSTNRETILSNLQQVNILATNNNDLTNEINTLEDHLNTIQQESENTQRLKEDILLYGKVSGIEPVSGPGISITITIPIDSYWIIDLINELNLAGAEAISINGIRYTNYSYLLTNFNPDPEIIINGKEAISIPITISAIGDSKLLKAYIEQETGTLKKLSNTYPDFTSLYYITSHEIITLPKSEFL